jgi:hypothetical protein
MHIDATDLVLPRDPARRADSSLHAEKWRQALDQAIDESRTAERRRAASAPANASEAGSAAGDSPTSRSAPPAPPNGDPPSGSQSASPTTARCASAGGTGFTLRAPTPPGVRGAEVPSQAPALTAAPTAGAQRALAGEASAERPATEAATPAPVLPDELPQWPAVNAQAWLQGQSVSAAVRDSELGPHDAETLKQRLEARLASSGLTLAELRVNGRVVGAASPAGPTD